MLSSLITRLPTQRAQRIAVRAASYCHFHKGALPTFIIIGAQKAGTTSLYSYLREHPDVLPCAYKEVWYFDLNYHKGTKWYRRQFVDPSSLPDADSRQYAVGEATPYYLFHPWAPQRIWRTVPDVKLIVLLRDPIARAYSQFQHNVRKHRESLSFLEAIERERQVFASEQERFCSDPSYAGEFHRHYAYLNRSCYADQLEEYLRYFDRRQLLILKSEELFADPGPAYAQTLEFLGLPRHELEDARALNVGRYDQRSIPGHDELRRHFEIPNRKLFDMLGVDFGW